MPKQTNNWEERLELFHYFFRNNTGYEKVKSFISQEISKAKQEERERCIKWIRSNTLDSEVAIGHFKNNQNL